MGIEIVSGKELTNEEISTLVFSGWNFTTEETSTFNVPVPPTPPSTSPSESPTQAPTISWAPSQAPTISCASDEIPFRLELLVDNAIETSWNMTKVSDGTIVGEGFKNEYKNNTEYKESLCLPNGDYSFTIFDGYGDGLTYGKRGQYYLFVNNIEIFSGSNEEWFSETTTFTTRSKCENLETFDCAKKASGKKECTTNVLNTGKAVKFFCPLNCKSKCATEVPS